MNTFEIKAPDLRRSRDVSNVVIDKLLAGEMDVKTANGITSAVNNLIRSVGTDLKLRLAMPGIIESEAKQIEGEKSATQRIEKSGTEANGNSP
jgi:hypothetical protein